MDNLDISVIIPTFHFEDSVRKVILAFKEIDLYFSGRMHGLILASIVNVKVSPYEVSNKIRVFKNESRDMKIDEAVSIIKNSLKR